MADRTPQLTNGGNPIRGWGFKMEWTVYPHEDGSGDWVVQAIDFANDGVIYTTIFSDYDAETRAQEYYAWKMATAKERVAT